MFAAGEQLLQQQQTANGQGVFDPDRLPPEARPYLQWIMKAGAVCDGVTPEIVAGIIQAESSWRPRLNEGLGGKAYGIAQFKTASWAEFGKDADGDGNKDVFSAADAIVSAGHYLCFIQDKVRGYIKDKKIPNLQGEGNVRDLMIVGYNKGPNIWLLKTWNGKPITFDSQGIPDAEDGLGTNGHEYLAMVNKAIDSFLSPPGAAPTTAARMTMKQAALGEVGTYEQPRGSNCQKYSLDLYKENRCVQWCAIFVSWIWAKGGFTYNSMAVAEFNGDGDVQTDFSKALPGDAVIYINAARDVSHIGIIVEVYEDGQIATVEGNSGSPLSDHVAYHKKFAPSARYSVGFVTPMNEKKK